MVKVSKPLEDPYVWQGCATCEGYGIEIREVLSRIVPFIGDLIRGRAVVWWLARWPSDLKVGGSTPAP